MDIFDLLMLRFDFPKLSKTAYALIIAFMVIGLPAMIYLSGVFTAPS